MGVLGGSGGVGASAFAAVLARACAPSTLVDCDAVGGGVDVLLGMEASAGVRWSGIAVDGGQLDPAALDAGVPHWCGVRVVAADGAVDPGALVEVVGAAEQLGTVVLDLPRSPSELRDRAAWLCTLLVVVSAVSVRGLAAARALVRSLPDVPVGLVTRAASTGSPVGVPVLGVASEIDPQRPARPLLELAAGILDGVSA